MKFGIIGAGSIAEQMAYTIMKMPKVNMYAIASRSIERAIEYKEKYNMQVAYGSYEAMLKDENVDVVYIATPHSFHYEQAKMCIEHGKHVLCEKAFTANAVIYGANGRIVVEGVNCPQCIKVFDSQFNLIEKYDREEQITGYEYEVQACVEDIKAGKIESQQMPHSKTLNMMKVMDEIRRQMGVVFPFEKSDIG